MAKASDASTTDWIWLRDALTLVHEALGSREGAERQVRKWLAAKALPWSCKSWEGPESAREDSRFWGVSQINWEDNSVRGRTLAGTNAWGVEVSRTHLVELLSPWVREREETPEPPKPVEPPMDAEVATIASARWAVAATRRLRDENKIIKGIKKAELARLLEAEAKKAVKAEQVRRALKASYMENELEGWGIWPLDRLK